MIHVPRAQLDNGCSLYAVMDRAFAVRFGIPLETLDTPIPVEWLSEKDTIMITQRTRALPVSVNERVWDRAVWFYVMDIGGIDVLFGDPWLVKHNPAVDWQERTLMPRMKGDPRRSGGIPGNGSPPISTHEGPPLERAQALTSSKFSPRRSC